MKLIVGLGNPGRYYAHNRHNTGFVCLNHFARTHGIRFDKKQGKARIGTGEVAGNQVIVAKPQTYMNLSGQSVSRLTRKFNVRPDNLLVIHDDLDLPPGKIRIRQGGSSGGHRGIVSIISCLGSRDFIRLRVGIGRPDITVPNEAAIIDHVLSDFTPSEKQIMAQIMPKVSGAILSLITEDLAAAMNKYN